MCPRPRWRADKAHARTGAVQVAFVGGGVLPRIGKAGARQTMPRVLDAEGGGAV